MSKAIDWSKAPEGTTHATNTTGSSPWLKYDGVIPQFWVTEENRWQNYNESEEGFKSFLEHLFTSTVKPKETSSENTEEGPVKTCKDLKRGMFLKVVDKKGP